MEKSTRAYKEFFPSISAESESGSDDDGEIIEVEIRNHSEDSVHENSYNSSFSSG